jgi:hypothetical protein
LLDNSVHEASCGFIWLDSHGVEQGNLFLIV